MLSTKLAKTKLETSDPDKILCFLVYHAGALFSYHITVLASLYFKCHELVKWTDMTSPSTMTQIAFFFEAKKVNPMMKSIEMESHF